MHSSRLFEVKNIDQQLKKILVFYGISYDFNLIVMALSSFFFFFVANIIRSMCVFSLTFL